VISNEASSIIRREEVLMRVVMPLIVGAMILCSALFAFSDILVVYTSGDCLVDIEGRGAWEEAEVDMALSEQSLIRTGANGAMEIDMDGELISIGVGRRASVGDLLGKVEQKKKVGFLKGLKKYASQMGSGGDEYTEMALAGVRGAPQAEAELEWFDEDDFGPETAGLERRYQEGLDHFNRGAYTAAIEVFHDIAEEYGDDVFDGELAYHLGLSLFRVMRFDEAARYLETSSGDKSAPFYGVALMHLSVSRYFMHEYSEAIDGFTFFTEGEGTEDLRPYALLMLGKCYRETGENGRAEGYFTEVERDYRGTEFADTADEELRSLDEF
jgi:TolA-binding protein